MKQKGFPPILIIILTVFVVFGYFGYKKYFPEITNLAKSSANIPENWKTYTKDNLGFSFKYPNDWYTTDTDLYYITNDKDGTIIQIHLYNSSDLPEGYSNIATWFRDFSNKNQNAILPNDGLYYGGGGSNPAKWYMYYNLDNFQDITIDNIASIATYSNTGVMYIVVPTTNNIYEIIVNPTSEYENLTVKEILSTFKFTQ